MAEIGLILLLFIIGLEIDLKKLASAGLPVAADRSASRCRSASRLGLGFFALSATDSGGQLLAALPGGLHEPVEHAGRGQAPQRQVRARHAARAHHPRRPRDPGHLGGRDARRAAQPRQPRPAAAVAFALLARARSWWSAASRSPSTCCRTCSERWPRRPSWCWSARSRGASSWPASASVIGLSREMGALIAGVSLSTFPYNLDVMAKAVEHPRLLRDPVLRRPRHADPDPEPPCARARAGRRRRS